MHHATCPFFHQPKKGRNAFDIGVFFVIFFCRTIWKQLTVHKIYSSAHVRTSIPPIFLIVSENYFLVSSNFSIFFSHCSQCLKMQRKFPNLRTTCHFSKSHLRYRWPIVPKAKIEIEKNLLINGRYWLRDNFVINDTRKCTLWEFSVVIFIFLQLSLSGWKVVHKNRTNVVDVSRNENASTFLNFSLFFSLGCRHFFFSHFTSFSHNSLSHEPRLCI